MFKGLRKKLREARRKQNEWRSFIKTYATLKSKQEKTIKRFCLEQADFYPCLDDNTPNTDFDRHYTYHPAWAARIIKQLRPKKHIDISSTLYFCSMLSAFVPVEFYDYRPANLILNNLKSGSADLTRLPFIDNSIESISCMHTIEHIGLGRYGDPIDYDGDLKAIAELKRVVTPGGSLLFVVPLGAKSVICFNAHRIYDKAQILSIFSDMELVEFALIPENEEDGGLVIDPSDALLTKQFYGCGCFWFRKKREINQ
ncbi:DUF268 domain-containing protein [Olivibacter sp. LS-1]|nr:DUF268 domain-containing protein [Olivibacter sp. LS-1]